MFCSWKLALILHYYSLFIYCSFHENKYEALFSGSVCVFKHPLYLHLLYLQSLLSNLIDDTNHRMMNRVVVMKRKWDSNTRDSNKNMIVCVCVCVCVCVMQQLSSKEINLMTQVQIWEKAVCIYCNVIRMVYRNNNSNCNLQWKGFIYVLTEVYC